MIILGVDPGVARTGWGLIEAQNRSKVKLVSYGCISTSASTPLPLRLKTIFQELSQLMRSNQPSAMAVEELFFSKEARTVAAVAQARGVILLAAEMAGIPIIEYNPRHVKIVITGYGSADKSQMQRMVQILLSIKELPKPDDAADALAIAMCHVNSQSWR